MRLVVLASGSVEGGVGDEPKLRLARLPRKVISPATRAAAESVASAPDAPATPSAWFCTSASAAMAIVPAAVMLPATEVVAASLARFTAIGTASDVVAPSVAAAASLRARMMVVAL